MRFLLLFLLWLYALPALGQREAANWYFGNNAGLDFNSGTPVPLLDGQLKTLEGCESFSDPEGNLLFYTDGNTVWNRLHEVMENGLLLNGSFSTSQSALVVPNPVQTNIYYVFTPDDVLAYEDGTSEESNGFNYSVIDMLGDGGRGSVIIKNIDLLTNASENVTAVRNFEEDNYWVVTHYLDSFFSYKVDANGVDDTPVISRVGPDIDNFENFRGSIKISPDGSKLAAAHTVIEPKQQGILYLYDFDSATGRVLNPTTLNASRVYYGVEFSSNSSKLYASGLQFANDSLNTDLGEVELVQFDLEEDNIASSEYVVHRYERRLDGKISGALQIGIDKKIYHSIPNETLSVIRTPNLSGINCDFRPFQLALGTRTSSYGLPLLYSLSLKLS
ncbi:hypothetical protein [Maribacter halichondriae]|uniref:hypothetical protein n=1 Tax=Maribacter halichondriae TaxID=2980554 RepID=UPI00235A0F02|nr:hypothetical protein [Maribacter sp. Hal144]